MGLGPSWVVLSVINMCAAYYASHENRSYSVCGDDLVSLWTREERERYVWMIEALGLKINHDKSFVGPRGVFCEQLVFKDTPISAHTQPVYRIAEAGASKLKAKFSGAPSAVADALRVGPGPQVWQPRKLRRLALYSRVLVSKQLGNLEGPAMMGGNGFGSPRRQLLDLISNPARLRPIRKQQPSIARQVLLSLAVPQSELKPDTKYVQTEDALILLDQVEREASVLNKGLWPHPNRILRPAKLRQRSRRYARMEIPTRKQVVEQLEATQAPIRKLGWLLRVLRSRSANRLCPKEYNLLRRHLTCKITSCIAHEDLQSVLEDSALMDSRGRDLLLRVRGREEATAVQSRR